MDYFLVAGVCAKKQTSTIENVNLERPAKAQILEYGVSGERWKVAMKVAVTSEILRSDGLCAHYAVVVEHLKFKSWGNKVCNSCVSWVART